MFDELIISIINLYFRFSFGNKMVQLPRWFNLPRYMVQLTPSLGQVEPLFFFFLEAYIFTTLCSKRTSIISNERRHPEMSVDV